MSSDYEQRAIELGFTSKEKISNLINEGSDSNNVIMLDVRSDEEIVDAPLPPGSYKLVHLPCTRTDASFLLSKAEQFLGDKNGTIIIFCRSGARAAVAKSSLETIGYKNVHNAGGLSDMDYISS